MGRVRTFARDALLLAGAGGVVFGVWQVYAPAGWIVGGLVVAILAVAIPEGAR